TKGSVMKVGIHKEPAGGVGGADYCVVVLAEALGKHHDVEIVHHTSGLSKDHLTQVFDASLNGVGLRFVPPHPPSLDTSWTPWRRYQEARDWQAELSKPYDLFVNFTHGVLPPPFCHAPIGVLVVLFPVFERLQQWPYSGQTPTWRSYFKKLFSRYYYDW